MTSAVLNPNATSARRIALDARMVAHSGIGTLVRGLLRAWQQSPPPFDLLALGDPGQLAAIDPSVLCTPWRTPIYGGASLLARPPVGPSDVFFTPHYAAPWFPGVTMVAVVHDLVHITHPTRPGTALFQRACLKRLRSSARVVITGCRHTKVQLQTLHGFAAHRVLTIPWGPGLVGQVEPADPPGLPFPAQGYILAVGLVKPHKNWGFLLDRLGSLWRQGMFDLPLVAAGTGTQGAQALIAMARMRGVAERLLVLDRLSDAQMLGVVRRAAVLAAPSLAEGFGFPLVEAMALGTPVLAPDLPPMNEIGADGATFFDPDSPETFDRALLELRTDGPARRDAIARGLKAGARFNWKQCASQVSEVFLQCLGEKAT